MAFLSAIPINAPSKLPMTTSYKTVIKIQSLIACPVLYESRIIYNPRYKNGNAMPSLLPDSADSKFRKWPGTRFANLPFPTTDDARTGSVAVTHAPTMSEST